MLGRRPGIEPATLAQQVGLSRARLSQLLKPLEQAGRVTRAHGGLFAGTGQTERGHDDQPPNDPHAEEPVESEQPAEEPHGDETLEAVGEAG